MPAEGLSMRKVREVLGLTAWLQVRVLRRSSLAAPPAAVGMPMRQSFVHGADDWYLLSPISGLTVRGG